MSQQKISSFVLLFYYYFLNLGEMWLLKRFKDRNPSMFKRDVDVRVAENQLCDMEKILKLYNPQTERKRCLQSACVPITWEAFRMELENKYISNVVGNQKAAEFVG